MRDERKRAIKGYLILALVVGLYFMAPYAFGMKIKWVMPPVPPCFPMPFPFPVPVPVPS